MSNKLRLFSVTTVFERQNLAKPFSYERVANPDDRLSKRFFKWILAVLFDPHEVARR